ncbi:unnamed protein product [Linum tenue]|uniref:Uncharacterized protein n=1 Tax=Linum tenue TaxID=586396 RepID=A0AAV0JZX0_9ROSI|nr:unnamed protein product [Linum tenue]
MLQFSKRLISKRIRVTLVLTRFVSKSITATTAREEEFNVRLDSISDGFDDGGMEAAESTRVYLDTFREVGSGALSRLIEKQSDAGEPVHCVVYDHCIPWCLDVAKKFGLVLIESTPLPWLPPLETRDLPSFVNDTGDNPGVLEMFKGQFSNLDQADWVICNTVYELEQQAVDWLTRRWPNFITIGPTIPSMYLDKQFPNDTDYGFSIFKPMNEICMNWLGDKPKGSVVGHYFLWVVRESEQSKLPYDFSSTGEEQKGLIVSWCPQLRVLASGAVGCFLTHCGWNSTLEALSLGVAMVAMPRWSDQTTNAKFIEDEWGVGVRAREGGDGLVKREEIERCVREVMEGEKAVEIRRNGDKWKKVMKDAVSEDGSSDRNVREFVDSLIRVCLW